MKEHVDKLVLSFAYDDEAIYENHLNKFNLWFETLDQAQQTEVSVLLKDSFAKAEDLRRQHKLERLLKTATLKSRRRVDVHHEVMTMLTEDDEEFAFVVPTRSTRLAKIERESILAGRCKKCDGTIDFSQGAMLVLQHEPRCVFFSSQQQ